MNSLIRMHRATHTGICWIAEWSSPKYGGKYWILSSHFNYSVIQKDKPRLGNIPSNSKLHFAVQFLILPPKYLLLRQHKPLLQHLHTVEYDHLWLQKWQNYFIFHLKIELSKPLKIRLFFFFFYFTVTFPNH